MNSKINSCYRNCVNPNETLFVKILNECPFFIYMGLNYTIHGQRVLKQSPVFAPNTSDLLTFPSGALYVGFRIFNCHVNPPQLIYTRVVRNYSSSCYKLLISAAGHINCIEIPC